MSPKTGRPRVDNPVSIKSSIRIDKNTDDRLENYCVKYGITKAEAIRKGIIFLLDSDDSQEQ